MVKFLLYQLKAANSSHEIEEEIAGGKVPSFLPTLLKLRHCHDLTESGFLLNLDSETVLLAEIRANYLWVNVTFNGNINHNRRLSNRQTLNDMLNIS